MVTAETAGFIELTFRVYPEDGQSVSECDELGVTSCGDTIDEALLNLDDATSLYLSAITESGDRARIFAERGVTMLPGAPNDRRRDNLSARASEIVQPKTLAIPACA